MQRKIVFINQSTGYTTIDIANKFSSAYDEVALIYGTIIEQDLPLNNDIKTSKIFPKKRTSNWGRFYSWLIAAIQIHFLLLTKYRKYEIFYFTLPPFSYLSSLLLKRRFSVMIYDVYPDVLKIMNFSEQNILYRLWAKLNRIVLNRAHKVFTISNGMSELLTQYVSRDKIKIIKLWSGLINAKPIEKHKNPFSIENDLSEKFVIEYSGNIGLTHQLEVLVELARLLKDKKDIHFLIIGRGVKVEKIRRLIIEYGLQNCELLPFQSEDKVIYSLASADLGVVVIDEKSAQMSIPSKIYNLMSVGVAIFAIAPKNSELNSLIEEYDVGRSFDSDDLEGMKEFILEMKNNNDKLIYYKNNSLKAAQKHTLGNTSDILIEYAK